MLISYPGAMIIPTVYPSLRDPEIYENPDVYDPDRYVTGDAEVKGAKNFLVFGTGPHYCLGQLYAQLNLALMIGKASMYLDWVHHPTPLSEEIKVFATIFPMVGFRPLHRIHTLLTCHQDDCPLTFTKRP
jgi:C-22 sterol desaturase